jgi:hypothetical protein
LLMLLFRYLFIVWLAGGIEESAYMRQCFTKQYKFSHSSTVSHHFFIVWLAGGIEESAYMHQKLMHQCFTKQ